MAGIQPIELIDLGFSEESLGAGRFGGFPIIMGTFLGAPIIRIIVFWGLYWGSLILGNYHLGDSSLSPLISPPNTKYSQSIMIYHIMGY